MQVPLIVRILLNRDLCRIVLHILDVHLVIDVRIDLLLSDQELELTAMVTQLSRNLSSQVAECLEEADVNAVLIAIFRVHRTNHFDLKWLDVGQPSEDLLRFQYANAFIAVEEQGKELSHCLLVFDGR